MKRMGAVELDSVKSARKAKDKLHKACERASETRERTLHGQEQNKALILMRLRTEDQQLAFLDLQTKCLCLSLTTHDLIYTTKANFR